MKENVIKVLKVKPHEHPEVCMLENSLEAMQEAVGGYIDIVGLDDNACILLNDEGKLIGLEGNRRIGSDIIVGDFFVCGSDVGCRAVPPPARIGIGNADSGSKCCG